MIKKKSYNFKCFSGEDCGVLYKECTMYPPHYRTPLVEEYEAKPQSLLDDNPAAPANHTDLDFNSSNSLGKYILTLSF